MRSLASTPRKPLNNTALVTVNTAALRPRPTASVITAVAVKPGLRRSVRNAWRTSCVRFSSAGRPRDSRWSCLRGVDAAEPYQRDAAGFGAGQSLLLEVVGRHLDVRGELFVHLAVERRASKCDRTRDQAALMTLIYPSLRSAGGSCLALQHA